jgi:hypothetical protein
MDHPIERSVARVWRGQSSHPSGSGFLILKNTVCTCAHVLTSSDDTKPIQENVINFPFIERHRGPANLLSWVDVTAFGGDIAFMSVTDTQAQAPRLLDAEFSRNTPCEVYGFPLGFEDGVWASGIIGNRDARGWYEISSEKPHGFSVKRGFSGAPVWDKIRQGIVGMIVAVDNDPATRVGFMIPIENVAQASSERVYVHSAGNPDFFDAHASELSVWGAGRLYSVDPVVEYLNQLLLTRVDPTERYWLYVTLGKIGGPNARGVLDEARRVEMNRFALIGLSEALPAVVEARL